MLTGIGQKVQKEAKVIDVQIDVPETKILPGRGMAVRTGGTAKATIQQCVASDGSTVDRNIFDKKTSELFKPKEQSFMSNPENEKKVSSWKGWYGTFPNELKNLYKEAQVEACQQLDNK